MKVAIVQTNPIIADLGGNVDRCVEMILTASAENPDLIVLPEMALPGCHPQDILFDSSFIQALSDALDDLADQVRGCAPTIIGSISPSGEIDPWHPGLFNAAFLLKDGETRQVAAKQLLRGDDVFHEPRWFLPGPTSEAISIDGKLVGVLFADDLQKGYATQPLEDLVSTGAEVLVCIAASPFKKGCLEDRITLTQRSGVPLLYANLVGGNDELIYDGRSFALNGEGEMIAILAGFEECFTVVDLEKDVPVPVEEQDPDAECFQALTLGVRDFACKNRVKQVFLGLSGGIDSALVAVIAAEAVGAENVTAAAVPSRYTDPQSTSSAGKLAHTLGINFEVRSMERIHQTAEEELGELLAKGTTGENIQARIRTAIIMSLVNHHGGMLLNTSNKTEISLGYSTIYGDSAGTLSPIGDLTKPEVYRMAAWINRESEVIPAFMIERKPSAELRHGQVDPFDYPKISPEIDRLIHEHRTNPAIRSAEHKRWQMGVVLKVSDKSFGSGRMIPITRR